VTYQRAAAIARVLTVLSEADYGRPVRVAIDGIVASGKSTIASEICEAVALTGRPAIHLTMDAFHHPRERRHRRGQMSARGYYDDAYDFLGFAREVLIPLGPDGNRRYRPSLLDLDTNQRVIGPSIEAARDAVVIVDGNFLQRPELRSQWDLTVFVDTSFDIARARGARRNAIAFGGEMEAGRAIDLRYHAAGHIYVDVVQPREIADIVINNDDFFAPTGPANNCE